MMVLRMTNSDGKQVNMSLEKEKILTWEYLRQNDEDQPFKLASTDHTHTLITEHKVE